MRDHHVVKPIPVSSLQYRPRDYFGRYDLQAQISIQSTTFDVTVLYARLVGKRIHYRMVDEYEGETLSGRNERTSLRPLTMGQMIDFFLGAWDLMECLDGNFDDLQGKLDFFQGESEFYPCFDQTLRMMVEER